MSEPFKVWHMVAPFDNHGVPRVGTYGQTLRNVIIMEADTFKRLIAEHPSLNGAKFLMGEFVGETASKKEEA